MLRLIRAASLSLLVGVPSSLFADALVVNRSMDASIVLEAFIDDGVMKVETEVSWAGLPAFADLAPDELWEGIGREPEPYPERIRRFFRQGLVLEADGERLPGRLLGIEVRRRTRRDPVSGEPMPETSGEEAEEVLFLEMEFGIRGRPDSLSVLSTPRAPDGTQADIGFVLYHHGVAVNDFRYLVPGLTADLDWSDPWHSRFRRRQMKRAYDAPLNVFLYAEPYEIRVEVVVRPLDLQPFIDLGLAGRKTILPEQYGSILEKVAVFLGGSFQMEIDGEPAEPVLDRVHFLRRTLRSSTVIDPPEELNIFAAQLGAIYVVPRTSLPKVARLTWSVFPENIELVPTAATDEAGPLPGTIDRDDPVLVWKNYLKNPTDLSPRAIDKPPEAWKRWLRPAGIAGMVLGGVCLLAGLLRSVGRRRPAWASLAAGALVLGGGWWTMRSGQAARISAGEAHEVVGKLLYNVYRSFDFRQEEAVYDMLSGSVAGPLLESTYLETRRSLVLRNQGGARAKVNEVELADVAPEPLDDGAGFRVDADWVVGGSVGHWGHIHQRSNRYRAELTVEPLDGAWKITRMEVRSEERIR